MEISDQIIAVIDNLCAKFGIAIDWTSENVIPYITELAGKFIKHEIAVSAFYVVLITIVFCISVRFLVIVTKKTIASNWDTIYCGPMAITCVLTTITAALFITSAVPNVIDIITCLTFPEKMIFEYVSALIN